MKKEILPTFGMQKDFMVIRWPNARHRFEPMEDSFRLSNGAFVIGQGGYLSVSVNLIKYRVEAETLLTIAPQQIVQIHEVSPDFRGYFLIFTPDFATDINLFRSNLPFLTEMRRNPLLRLKDNEHEVFVQYCDFFEKIDANPLTNSSPEIRKGLLTSVLYTLGTLYRQQLPERPIERQSRANLIFHNFLALLVEHYIYERGVAFYAGKLCITPKYLGTVCREVSGKLATDIIANAVILDAKARLHNSTLTVQEISNQLHFPNASFFGRYFKRHTGYSPMQYRETL